MRIDVFDRQDRYVSTISDGQLLSATHTDELNGEDSLAVTTTFPLREGMRLVWSDAHGGLHEHVCQDPKGASVAGVPIYTDTALNSICELFGDYIEDRRPHGYGFDRALGVALEATRWDVGTVDQPGTVSDGLTFYHTSAREAVKEIVECGGELETGVEVGDAGVTRRTVSIRRHRGASDGHRRFSYGKDVTSIARTEHWGAITACYGYGKGVETDSGGYGRKLTFGELNGGRNYVEDRSALERYGRPDGRGGLSHIFGKYENGECEDAAQLMRETRDYLDAHSEPGVTYEAAVVDLVAMGRGWEGVGVGDDVQIVDSSFSPTLRCEGRVTKLVTDLLGGSQVVTLGNVVETMSDILQQHQQQIGSLQQSAGSWDAASSTTPAYLEQLVASLNRRFNQQGMSYTHTSFERGTIWSSVPLDAEGRPTATGGSAIQICSQGLRIASRTRPDGSFDWRSFGTGEGFVADLITAGTLDANLIRAGIIRDGAGKNFWNLDTGEFALQAGATVGGETVRQIAQGEARGAVESQTQLDVFNRLTNGGQAQGIYLDGGRLHVNGEYIRAGTISTDRIEKARNSDAYIKVGLTSDGYAGQSNFAQGANYLNICALHAVDSPADEINGFGMETINKSFLSASSHFGHLWLTPPLYDGFMKHPAEQLYMSGGAGNSRVRLQRKENQGLFFGDGWTELRHDATHYVRVDASGVQCRCGQKGFGWLDGKFYTELKWG